MMVDKMLAKMEYATKAEADDIMANAVAHLVGMKQIEEREKWMAIVKMFMTMIVPDHVDPNAPKVNVGALMQNYKDVVKAVKTMHEALEEAEWSNAGDCPVCGGTKPHDEDGEGHSESCDIKQALIAYDEIKHIIKREV
jgi:hypothetical protein